MHKINFSIAGFDVSHALHLCFIMTFVKITTFLAAACFCNHCINPLTPNDHCSGRTAPLTSKVALYIFIQQI